MSCPLIAFDACTLPSVTQRLRVFGWMPRMAEALVRLNSCGAGVELYVAIKIEPLRFPLAFPLCPCFPIERALMPKHFCPNCGFQLFSSVQ